MLLPALAVTIQMLHGAPIDALATPSGTKAIVYIFTATDCPISNRYAPEIQRLQQQFGPRRVLFRLVYLNRAEPESAIRRHMTEFAYSSIQAVRDPDFELVRFTGATITPEAVIVADGRMVYRGRIDDRYASLGVERPSPTTRDLFDALSAVVAGRPVAQPVTQAIGCFIADLAR
jgi:thiol-disulfide isomerase/thioredoxin